MERTGEQKQVRLEIAAVLDAIAADPGWSDALYAQFDALLKLTDVDGILSHADEELIHYSGQFNARSIFNRRVELDKDCVEDYKAAFRELANAIRSGTTWNEYKRANRISEGGELLRSALKEIVARVRNLVTRAR
jgi:hypothetical protein